MSSAVCIDFSLTAFFRARGADKVEVELRGELEEFPDFEVLYKTSLFGPMTQVDHIKAKMKSGKYLNDPTQAFPGLGNPRPYNKSFLVTAETPKCCQGTGS